VPLRPATLLLLLVGGLLLELELLLGLLGLLLGLGQLLCCLVVAGSLVRRLWRGGVRVRCGVVLRLQLRLWLLLLLELLRLWLILRLWECLWLVHSVRRLLWPLRVPSSDCPSSRAHPMPEPVRRSVGHPRAGSSSRVR
jgi:hypothetical protein